MIKRAERLIEISPANLFVIRKYYLNMPRIYMASYVGMSDYKVKKGETVPESEEAKILCRAVRHIYNLIKDIPQFAKKGIILQ